MRADAADQGRAHEKIILIEVDARTVVVIVKAELRRVTVPARVLPEEVGDQHGLVAEVRRVQFAVGVLLQHVEVGDVVLITIVGVVAEQPCAEPVHGNGERAQAQQREEHEPALGRARAQQGEQPADPDEERMLGRCRVPDHAGVLRVTAPDRNEQECRRKNGRVPIAGNRLRCVRHREPPGSAESAWWLHCISASARFRPALMTIDQ